MIDDDLKRMLTDAHGAERAPSLEAVVARKGGTRVRGGRLALGGLAAACALYALAPRGGTAAHLDGGLALAPTVTAVAMPEALDLPLDFLLEAPRTEWMQTTPRYDSEGDLP